MGWPWLHYGFVHRLISSYFCRVIQLFLTKTENFRLQFRRAVLPFWLLVLGPGFFLFFVLYVYQGFNIYAGDSASGHDLLSRALMFGGLTSLSFGLLESQFGHYFRSGKRYQLVLWRGVEILIGANLTFLLFNYFWNWQEFYWHGYFLMLFEYTSVMVFPLLISDFLRKPVVAEPLKPVSTYAFQSENGKSSLEVQADSLLFIKSDDNYVEFYLLVNDRVEVRLQRNSLKRIGQQLADRKNLVRCHRSFMVHRQQIKAIESHSGKMHLNMGHGHLIPVSASYRDTFV